MKDNRNFWTGGGTARSTVHRQAPAFEVRGWQLHAVAAIFGNAQYAAIPW